MGEAILMLFFIHLPFILEKTQGCSHIHSNRADVVTNSVYLWSFGLNE